MINLIPNQEKKQIAKNFYVRLIGVFYATLGASVIIGATSLLPSYFITLEYRNQANDKIAKQENMPNTSTSEETLAVVREVDEKLSLIENNKGKTFLVSEKIVRGVLKHRTPAIKINSILFEGANTENKMVVISGVASSRDGLLAFKTSIEGDVSWKSVNLPISNFVKGSDIPFSLTLVPN